MQKIYTSLSKKMKSLLKKCTLLALDFDGTLTDNGVFVDELGHESVRCDRSDSLGLEYLWRYTDVKVVILSKEKNPVVSQRAKKLNIPYLQGIDDKSKALEQFILREGHEKQNVCFVGNDLNDIEVLAQVGIPIAVADACPQVKKSASYITKRPGGHGAIREVCELLLYAKNKHPYP